MNRRTRRILQNERPSERKLLRATEPGNARLSSLEFPRLKFSRAEFSRNLVPRNLRIRRHNGRAGNNSKSQRFRLFWLTGTKLTDTRARCIRDRERNDESRSADEGKRAL
jgi:hypothetical protein